MKRIISICFSVVVFISTACSILSGTAREEKKTPTAECGCDSLWSQPTAKDFTELLEKTTSSDYPIWTGYNIGDAAFILNAGQIDENTHCLGLWKKGEVISYKCSKDIPKMLTPLYSYYLNYADTLKSDSQLFATYRNAPEFSAWMESNQVEAAVYMPTDFPDFPFEIPTKMKVQLAIHEAFHIEVTLRKWYTDQGFWPHWDSQPDRTEVQSCYSHDALTQELIEKEQETLALLIEALLDQRKNEAVSLADEFIGIRQTRYDHLEGKQIKLDDETYGDCSAAESIMEIEEGIADYASWVKMFNMDVVTREDLLKRYRAKQKDRFYLTGSMLLHASVLMSSENEGNIIAKMVNAPSLEEGNLLSIFKQQLATYRKP